MVELPAGTVTFLFTDIQDSTPLWEQFPEAMRPAVALHTALIIQAIEEHGGVAFKTIGDAVQAAFPLADHALEAALAAQRSLQSAEWPTETGPLLVRMGLHTGPAEVERSSGRVDYAVSHTLNRVARIMSAGHGGQILLSLETAKLVEHDLPPEISFKDMGEHHMKGMTRLEHLFQVCAPGLPVEFPPLATIVNHPNNLPALLTSFIGREVEMEALQHLVTSAASRLVTLTGPGGTGKTRLAIQVAFTLLSTFPDGVWLVELAPLADPALVQLTVAAALNLHETPGKPLIQSLIEHLNNRHVLLILDNCEHVVEEAADLAGLLLQSCPQLQILATSREILGTMGETPFRVPSLALPGPQAASLDELEMCESVRLFVERASTSLPAFRLTQANAPVVARICQRLDGIPLAIELAAARVRLLSVEQISERLDDSFRLLTGGSRTVLSRHQTLRALIDWSYNLLSLEEKALFQRLSVFSGGFMLDSVEHVCSDQSPPAGSAAPEVVLDPEGILDLLSQLVDKSLVIPVEGSPGEDTRYRMLETIRQYARDRLHDGGAGPAIRDQHLVYFLLMAEEAEPYLRASEQIAWLDRLDAELDNLRLALEWSLTSHGDEGLRLAAALLWFWHIRGHSREGIDWLHQLLTSGQFAASEAAPPYRRLIRARALISSGFLTYFQDRPDACVPALEEAIKLLRDAGPAGRRWLGVALLFRSKPERDHDQRKKLLEEALPYLREAGDPLYLAEHAMEIGGILTGENNLELALKAYLESLAFREETQDLDGIGTATLALGDMALFRRDYAECTRMYERSLTCFQKVKNKVMESNLFSRLGNLDLLTGNFDLAARRFSAGMVLNQQMGDRLGMINSMFDLGRLDLNLGEFIRAGQRFAEIALIGEEVGSKQAILAGLLYQGLAVLAGGNNERARELTQQAIAFWREVEENEFNIYFTAGSLENLALLMTPYQPDHAARLFGAIDHSELVSREFNSAKEISLYENYRSVARQALGAEAYQKAVEAGEKLSIHEALEFVKKNG